MYGMEAPLSANSEIDMWSMIVTHPIVVHRLMVLVHMVSLSLIAGHVVFDAAAVAVGRGAARIDNEIAVEHLSSYLGVGPNSLSRIKFNMAIQMINYTF